MSILRRPTAMKTALNLFSKKISPYSSSSFRSIRILAGVSIPRPTPTRPHVFFRGFSAMSTNSEANETNLVDGRDNEHWFIVVEPPKGNPSRDEIIDCYIKTLAKVLGRFYFFNLYFTVVLSSFCLGSKSWGFWVVILDASWRRFWVFLFMRSENVN